MYTVIRYFWEQLFILQIIIIVQSQCLVVGRRLSILLPHLPILFVSPPSRRSFSRYFPFVGFPCGDTQYPSVNSYPADVGCTVGYYYSLHFYFTWFTTWVWSVSEYLFPTYSWLVFFESFLAFSLLLSSVFYRYLINISVCNCNSWILSYFPSWRLSPF